MFDWLRRMFGEGKFRVEIVSDTGERITAKVPYQGSLSTYDEAELIAHVKNQLWVDHGVKAKTIRVVGVISQ